MAFLDEGEFEAMKTLSGWETACCEKRQFCAKIKVSTRVVFELSLFDKWSEQRKKEDEKWHFHDRTIAFSCLPRGFWPFI